jgi:selT/selW/selH-like putative selenoprotein
VNVVFAATVGLLALWDRSDQWHEPAEQAFALLTEKKSELFTTSFVMIECANAAARRPYRSAVDGLRTELARGGFLIHPTQEEWDAAWSAYASGDASDAGVVDHTSFIVMRRLGITKAFTNDRHFRAAGSELLFWARCLSHGRHDRNADSEGKGGRMYLGRLRHQRREKEMQISIKYCMEWNYYPTAAGLADAIKKDFGVEPTMIEGSGGVFDVHVDGTPVWNKHETGRCPEYEEVLAQLRSRAGKP